jgi:hypothetical protein
LADNALVAPQLVLHSRMIYTSWIPADPEACARLLPRALRPAPNRAVYMNHYVVDSAQQTTGFGAYSLTYLGLDVADHLAPAPPSTPSGRSRRWRSCPRPASTRRATPSSTQGGRRTWGRPGSKAGWVKEGGAEVNPLCRAGAPSVI